MDLLRQCGLCPRKCGINRYETTGFCGIGAEIRIARAALHYMEEPCISGNVSVKELNLPAADGIKTDNKRLGSGTIFFSGCNLKCCYCQNHKLSHDNFGKSISAERLAEIFLELQEKGANNINLVTAVMYVPQIIKSLNMVKDELKVPVVYNSGGYESIETIRMLKDYVDIYLVDIKYYSRELGVRYSAVNDYFDYAVRAVEEMMKQKGKPEFYDEKVMEDAEAVLKSGVIIRHLVLPGARHDSIRILNELAKRFDKNDYILSLMSQFTPHFKCGEFKEINRRVTSFEYDSVVKEAVRLGLDNTYIQDRTSVGEEYTPPFNLEGC